MKKFTLVSLARTKKSATSALMGLAILFVTLNFVSANLSIKVYSSNPNVSDGAGIQNNGTADGAFPFWDTGLPDDEATARMMFEGDEFHLWDTYFQNDETEPRIMFEDDDFPTLTTSLQNNDAEEAQNLSLNTVDRPASTDEFFRKDLNLLDFEDSLYGHFSFHRPNLTKTLSERRFDDPQNQERYKSALDYYEAKKSEHELLEDYPPKNDPSESDYLDDLKQETLKKFNDSQERTYDFNCFNDDPFERAKFQHIQEDNIILTYDNREAGNFANRLNSPNTAPQPSSLPIPRRASDVVAFFPYDKGGSSSDDDSSYSEGGSFHRDGSPNLLAQAPDILPPPAGLFEVTNGSPSTITCHFYRPEAPSGNNPDAVATKNISYTPLHKRTRSEVTSTYGITNGNDLDAFPSIWDDILDDSE